MVDKWQTPQKIISKQPFATVSTATKLKHSPSKQQQQISHQLYQAIESVSNDNVLLIELLEANAKHNNTNMYWKNKYTLGQVLKQLSILKDLLNQHGLLGKFWEQVKQNSILFTFIVLQIILKDKRSMTHADKLFGAFSQQLQTLKSMNKISLRKQFFAFVNNRISRKPRQTPMYQIKLINPTCKTIRLQFNKQDQLVELANQIQKKDYNTMRSRLPSQFQFKKILWEAWDKRF